MNHDDPKLDDFEQHLRRQPPAPLPAAWRAEILSAARAATAQSEPESRAARPWQAAWWPSPWAWASVAALWLVIFALNFATNAETPRENIAAVQISPEALRIAFSERERQWAELFPPSETEPPPTVIVPARGAPTRPRKSGARPFTPVTV